MICENCGEYCEPLEAPDELEARLDELADLIAEAAVASLPAKAAYAILREVYPTLPTVEARQWLIASRRAA